MAPLANNISIDPKLAIEKMLASKKSYSSKEDPKVLAQREAERKKQAQKAVSAVITKGITSGAGVNAPVVPTVIKTPVQQTVRSTELPIVNPTTLPNGQPIIAGNVSPQSMESQPDRKYMTRDKVKSILMNAPEGVDKSTLLDDIVGQGYIVEGYNDAETLVNRGLQSGSIERIAPQISYGENKIQPEKTLLGTIKGFGQDVAESYNKRASNIQEGQVRYSGGGVKNTALDIVNSLSQGMGAFQDIVGSGIGRTFEYGFSKLPDDVQRIMKERLEYDLKKPSVQAGLQALNQGMENYASWKQQNPDTAVVTDFVLNGVQTALDLAGGGVAVKGATAGGKATLEAGEQIIKRAPGVAQDIVQGAKNIKNIPSKIGDLGEGVIEYGAKKLTNTVDDQGKLFKAQSPRMGQLNKKVDFENLRKNSDTANEEIVKAGFKPTDTASRADAHYKTMQKIWNDEVKAKIGDNSDIDLNPVADAIEKFAREADAGGIIKNKSQVQELLDQAAEFRKLGKVDGARGEFIKEMMNAKINNWGDSTIGDIYKNGLKQGTRELGKILDDTFSAIPGQFSEAKKRFGALKATFEDVVKADIKAQRAKGLGIEETFSRIEGVGDLASGVFGVMTGKKNFQDIASGIAKIAVGKTLKKVRDPDFLIREGFEGLSKKVKKVDNLDIQKMGNRQPLPYKPTQATSVSPKGQVMIKNPQPPIPKKSPIVVIEKGTANKPGTTKIDLKAIGKQMEQKVIQNKTNLIESELKRLQSDTTLQKVQPFERIPSNVKGKGFVTQYGPIDKVEFDRGREVYEIGGKTYKASDVEIYKPKEAPVVKKFTSEQELKIDSLKKYKEQGQRKRSYLQELLNGKSIDSLEPKQVDDIFELVNKRKRDDTAMSKLDTVKQGETPVKTAPKSIQTKIEPKSATPDFLRKISKK